MPTHIFTRLGHWDEVIAGNLAAADAALEHPAGDAGQYVWDEFPHAIEYLVYAYLQQGADSAAWDQLTRLRATDKLQPTIKTAFHISSIPARYVLERRAWSEAADLVPRADDSLDWDRFPWPEAVTWFALGLGAVHEQAVDDGWMAHERLEQLEGIAEDAGEALVARQIRMLRLGVSAWVAQASGEHIAALALMERAAELERTTPKPPVTPGPILPADELLGDLLLEQGDAERALAAYRRALDQYPNRFNSMLGAARAARSLNDDHTAATYYRLLLDSSVDRSDRAGIAEARAYLATSR